MAGAAMKKVVPTFNFALTVCMIAWSLFSYSSSIYALPSETRVRLKEIGRIDSWRDNQLVGYGLVTGLAGSGDSARNRATRQSIANLLSQFDVTLPSDQVQSRNVAAVMITATLPVVAEPGDKVDVVVTSIGDARSLVGGILLITPLKGVDGNIYALAQGSLSVGGYKIDANGNVVQKNHPTTGMIPNGANVEVGVQTPSINKNSTIKFILTDPDYTTSYRIAEAVNMHFGAAIANPLNAGKIEIKLPDSYKDKPVYFLTQIENLQVDPDKRARVVINERTGTVVSGGDVRITKVTITHGDLKVSVMSDDYVSQPSLISRTGPEVRTAIINRTRINVSEDSAFAVQMNTINSVADLVQSLNKLKVSPRDVISILQGIKAAGALRADLIIQ